MSNWETIDELITKLTECVKENIEDEKINENYSENEWLIEKLDEHIDQALVNNEGQYKIIEHYGYWNTTSNNSLAECFENAIQDLKDEIWEILEKELLNTKTADKNLVNI